MAFTCDPRQHKESVVSSKLRRVIRVILGIAFLLTGTIGFLIGATYLPALWPPSISVVRVVAGAVTPVLLFVAGIGMFRRARWLPRVLWTAFAFNLVVEYPFFPMFQVLAYLLTPIPFGPFVAIHTLNLAIMLLAFQTAKRAEPVGSAEGAQRGASGMKASWLRGRFSVLPCVLGGVIALASGLWAVSCARPMHTVGALVNPQLLHIQVDILDISAGRVFFRGYSFNYGHPEPFIIESRGGMPLGTDMEDLAPLEHHLDAMGFTLGYEAQFVPYRVDYATDIGFPLWFVVLSAGSALGALILRPRLQRQTPTTADQGAAGS